jgi:hypothetical protein
MADPGSQWEYKIEEAASVERMNELGADGWELIELDGTRTIFRRPALTYVERVTLEQRAHYYESLGLVPETDE